MTEDPMLDHQPPAADPADLPEVGDLGEHPPTLVAPPTQARRIATADYLAAAGLTSATDEGLLTARLLELHRELTRINDACTHLQTALLDALDLTGIERAGEACRD